MFPIQTTGPNLTHKIVTQPAPTGGLNTRDPLANMPQEDCPLLINWIPDIGGLQVRRGYKEWAINLGDLPIESIFSYFNASDTFPAGTFLSDPTIMPGDLFAATQEGIYTISAMTSTPVLAQALSDVANAGWFSTAMLANSAGSYLLAVSEVDGYFHYNGTVWTQVASGVGAGQMSGLNPADAVHVSVWKRRAWFVKEDSTEVWYLAADAIAGVATKFDFGPLLKKGGEIAYTASWTIDAGEGIDDFFVVVSTNGEVLVYKGTDPASADTFALVGSWYVGQIPVGRRGYCQLGGDLIILSSDGVFPISYVTRGGADFLVASSKEYSSKIRPSIGADLKSSFTVRGWQLVNHSGDRLLVASVPDYGLGANAQYAMNTSLMAWTSLLGIPAYSLCTVGGYMLMGTLDGRVLLYNGAQDNVPFGDDEGVNIETQVQFSFSYFGTPALEKRFHMARATFLAAREPGSYLTVATNFRYVNLVGPVVPQVPVVGAIWDLDLWDDGIWDGLFGVRPTVWHRWVSTTGIGFCGAAVLYANFTVPGTLAAMDYMYEAGGPL